MLVSQHSLQFYYHLKNATLSVKSKIPILFVTMTKFIVLTWLPCWLGCLTNDGSRMILTERTVL